MSIQELINRSVPSNFYNRLQKDFLDFPAGSGHYLQQQQTNNLRQISQEEIAQLIKQNNYCSKWELIKVGPQFQTTHIIGNQFLGNCALGNFTGKSLETEIGTNLPTGIYYSTLQNVELNDDCLIHRCPRLDNVIVAAEAVVLPAIVLPSTCRRPGPPAPRHHDRKIAVCRLVVVVLLVQWA